MEGDGGGGAEYVEAGGGGGAVDGIKQTDKKNGKKE